jgi:hypothetical protein
MGCPSTTDSRAFPMSIPCPHFRSTLQEKACDNAQKRSTLLRSIYVDSTYTIGKALNIFLESIYFGFLRNLFRLLKRCRQNLTKVMWENRGHLICDDLKARSQNMWQYSKSCLGCLGLLRWVAQGAQVTQASQLAEGEPRWLAPKQEQQAY